MATPAVEARWRESWALFARSAFPDSTSELDRLVELYAEPHRAYHDLSHVVACLDLAREVRGELQRPGLVELAMWYHDAIYESRRSDNEEASARLAAQALTGLSAPEVAEVARLILATRHETPPADRDAQYLVDIDLAILGAPPASFDAYESAIRHEYRWVPGPLYRRGRRDVLNKFLSRGQIYSTERFRRKLEEPARANISRSLARLK